MHGAAFTPWLHSYCLESCIRNRLSISGREDMSFTCWERRKINYCGKQCTVHAPFGMNKQTLFSLHLLDTKSLRRQKGSTAQRTKKTVVVWTRSEHTLPSFCTRCWTWSCHMLLSSCVRCWKAHDRLRDTMHIVRKKHSPPPWCCLPGSTLMP